MVVYGEMRTGILNGGWGSLSRGIQLRGSGQQTYECGLRPYAEAVSAASALGRHGISYNRCPLQMLPRRLLGKGGG